MVYRAVKFSLIDTYIYISCALLWFIKMGYSFLSGGLENIHFGWQMSVGIVKLLSLHKAQFATSIYSSSYSH